MRFVSGSAGRVGPLVAVALLLGTGCPHEPEPKRQAILILLDAARPDRFSSHGYPRETTPAMDRLAAGGMLFRNHFSQGTDTRDALPSLLYSRYYSVPVFPASARVPLESPDDLFRTLDAEARSLPRILSGAGFSTCAISAHVWVRPGARIAGEFDELHVLKVPARDDESGVSWTPYAGAERVVDRAIQWLEDHLHEDYFLYLHLMDTHFPHPLGDEAREFLGGEAPPAGRFNAGGRPREPQRPLSEAERRYLDAVYDGDLRRADQEIGRLVQFLESRGRLDGTRIVITSDHGEHLMEVPGRFEHGGPWLDRVARIPLILRYPARIPAGTEVDSLTESVDVLPTVLGLLGVPLPDGIRPDGEDVSDPAALSGDPVFAPAAVRDGRYKAIFTTGDPVLLGPEPPDAGAVRGRLHDLLQDPDELHDLWDQRPEVARSLLAAYRQRMAGPFHRYRAAETRSQPTRPFAISALHYRVDPPPRKAPGDPSSLRCGQLASPWFRSGDWRDPALFAAPRADPVRLRFPLPPGSYRLTASVKGAGMLRHDGRMLHVSGPDFRPWSPVASAAGWEAGDVEIGDLTLEGETFAVDMRPAGDGCFLVRHFGFTPLRDGEPVTGMTEDERRSLRALGYVD